MQQLLAELKSTKFRLLKVTILNQKNIYYEPNTAALSKVNHRTELNTKCV